MVAVPEEHGAPVPSPPPAVSQLDADMLELSRPYRLQGLKGAFESFVVSFGGEINSLIRDQYLLFGPLEAAASSTRFAELDAVQAELTRVQAELVQEREQRQQAESTHQARVAEEEGRRKTAEKTAADAQAEVQSLKNEILEYAREKEHWSKELEAMKNTLRTSENKAAETI